MKKNILITLLCISGSLSIQAGHWGILTPLEKPVKATASVASLGAYTSTDQRRQQAQQEELEAVETAPPMGMMQGDF